MTFVLHNYVEYTISLFVTNFEIKKCFYRPVKIPSLMCHSTLTPISKSNDAW